MTYAGKPRPVPSTHHRDFDVVENRDRKEKALPSHAVTCNSRLSLFRSFAGSTLIGQSPACRGFRGWLATPQNCGAALFRPKIPSNDPYPPPQMKLQEFNVTVVNHRAGGLFGPNFVPYSGKIFDMFATQLPRAL